MLSSILLALASVQASAQAQPPPRVTPLFTDIGARALPGVVTLCGSPAKDWILEVNGGGVLLGDFDADAKLDVVIVDGSTLERVEKGEPGNPPRLFLGRGDGTFAPAGERWAMSGGRFGMGGASGDLDRDGDLDLVITQWGALRVILNEANQGFRELEVGGTLAALEWSSSAALFDFDRDGWLDLLRVNYLDFDPKQIAKRGSPACVWKSHPVMCGPQGLKPMHARLYRGRGEAKFEDVSEAAGLRGAEPGFGLGALTLDYDLDGDADLYVANDSTPNFLWENQGDGTFREVGLRRGVSHDANGKEQASMGIGAGDVNGDLREDLFVTNFSGENNVLYASTKSGGFRERSSMMGLAGTSVPKLGWGTTIADFDLDGDLDISVMNGHVYPEADEPGTDTSYAQEAQLYVNDGRGRFTAELLAACGPLLARASAAGDLDDDGDLDLVAVCVEGPVRVFLNQAPRSAATHWLRVRLRGSASNRDGIGARVSAELEHQKLVAEIRTSGGFQAAVPAEAHFGLGSSARVRRLTVLWPSGRTQLLEDLAADRVLVVEEPSEEPR